MSLAREKTGKKSLSNNIPSLEPVFEEQYQSWEFQFLMVTKSESSQLSDLVSFIVRHPDKAEEKYPWDESLFAVDEQWSTESDTSDDEEERKTKTEGKGKAAEAGRADAGKAADPHASQDARMRPKRTSSKRDRRALRKKMKERKEHAKAMRKLSLYVSLAFKHPTLVALCMTVAGGNPVRMLVLVKRRFGGANTAGMIKRMLVYISSYPRGDIELWLDRNRYLEESIQRDYGGKIPDEFFSVFLLMKFKKSIDFRVSRSMTSILK